MPNADKPEIRNSKLEIRNNSEIQKFKCLKRNYRRDWKPKTTSCVWIGPWPICFDSSMKESAWTIP